MIKSGGLIFNESTIAADERRKANLERENLDDHERLRCWRHKPGTAGEVQRERQDERQPTKLKGNSK